MSNTVKIKNRKKKKEVKVNYRLWAIVFGVFVALVVGVAVWASFHWGVGMGSIGASEDNAAEAATEAATGAVASPTDNAITLTPEQLEQMGITVEDGENAEAADAESGAEDAAAGGAEDAAKDGAVENESQDAPAEGEASQDAGAQGQ